MNSFYIPLLTRKNTWGFISCEGCTLSPDEQSLLLHVGKVVTAFYLRIDRENQVGERKDNLNAQADVLMNELGSIINELQQSKIESLGLIEKLNTEIEKHRQTEIKLEESEELFRLVMENSMDAILITIPDGRILKANKAACELFRMSEGEILEARREGLVDMEDPNLKVLLAERESKGSAKGTLRFIRNDGTKFKSEISSTLFSNRKGEVMSSMIIRDITEREAYEEKLKISDRIFNHAGDVFTIAGLYGYLNAVNPAWEKITGWTSEELTTNPWIEFVHPADRQATLDVINQAEAGSTIIQFENRVICRDGSYKWFAWDIFPYIEDNTLIGVASDITEKKEFELALTQSENRYKLLLDSVAEGIYGLDINGNCTFCNQSALQILGYTSGDELIGRNMHDMIHHSHADGSTYPVEYCKIFKAAKIGSGIHVDDEVLWKRGGQPFNAEYWSYPIFQDGKPTGTVVTFLDISERVKIRKELLQLKESLEEKVKEKTEELSARVAELERFKRATVDREFRIKELKDEIKKLKNNKTD